MNISYKLTNTDFLEYQLYTSSRSKLHKKRRFRSRIIVPIIYLLIGFYESYKNQKIVFGIILSIAAIIWFILHPLYSKWRYKKHFQKNVEANYKNRIGKLVEIDFERNLINAKDFTSESRINGSEIKELIETKNHFFIKLTTDLSLIIPKHSIENKTEFKEKIIDFGAQYVNEVEWKWK